MGRVRKRVNRPLLLAVACMVLVGAAARMPWVDLGEGAQLSGLDLRDGRITLVAACAGLVVTALGLGVLGARRITTTARLVISAIAGGITVMTSSGDLTDATGYGLWLTLVAGLLWVFAVIWEYNEGRRL